MIRAIVRVVTFAVLLSSTMSLAAHDQFRIIGTIVKFEKLQLYVDTSQGGVSAFQLQEGTPIYRDKKRVPATELKAGHSVVVDFMGETPYDDDLFVVAVTLVPAIPRPRTT
jgi:hypothetical protein